MNLIMLTSAHAAVEVLVKIAKFTCISLFNHLWDVLNYSFQISEQHWYITLHMAFKLLYSKCSVTKRFRFSTSSQTWAR